jgi:ferredoxin-NADP reductase
MTAHEIKLVALRKREVVAKDTLAVVLDKPPGFTFKAGQAIDVSLIDPPELDGKGPRRAFSIVSAPHEDHILLATRTRDSAFKRVLGGMPIGGRVQVEGPFGSLTLHSNRSRPAIFLAGGIGITPFMSILRDATHKRLPQVITLLYSNRRPEDAAFLQELQQLERDYRGSFKLLATMTDPPDAGQEWRGRSGMIDAELIRSVIVEPSRPIFYVVGPPAMVAGIRQLLNSMGIDDDDVRSEDFSGY